MASVNRVILVGNLGQDPEMRTTTNGRAMVNFSMATSRRFTRKDGQAVNETEWHKVVGFGRQAEICGDFLCKGKQVYVEGRLQSRRWEDDQGNQRKSSEILLERVTLLGRKDDGGGKGLFKAVGDQAADPSMSDLPF